MCSVVFSLPQFDHRFVSARTCIYTTRRPPLSLLDLNLLNPTISAYLNLFLNYLTTRLFCVMDVLDFLEEVEALGRYDAFEAPIIPEPPVQRVYLRNITDPFDYYDDETFRERFRFRKSTVKDVIVPLLHAGDHHTSRGLPIPVELQAAMALRYYATGSFQVTIGDLAHVSQPTVSRIVSNVSRQLAGKVKEYVKFPENMAAVSQQFEQAPQNRYPGLRHVIGAIDCTHVKITRPRNIDHSEVYRNRKGYFSVNVQAVVGQDMKIYDIVARWPGSTHDSRIFRNSRLHAELECGRRRGILVGDSGYRSTHYMLTPYVNPTTRAQEKYNYVQIHTRNVVERFFGAYKRRFECLRNGISTKLTTATAIIVACAVLHNIAREENEEDFEDPHYREIEPARAQRNPPSGLAFRNSIVHEYYS